MNRNWTKTILPTLLNEGGLRTTAIQPFGWRSLFRFGIKTILPTRLLAGIALVVTMLMPDCLSAQVAFWPEEMVSLSAGQMRLGRSADRSMALDSAGRLHLVYYSGGIQTNPTTPSWVLYRMRSNLAGWGAESSVDDSYVGAATSGTRLGGREPAVVADASDTVWVFWHDARHCVQTPGNWINNLELYADTKVQSGTFTRSDLRLTDTSAAHIGDNGYSAKPFIDGNGRITVSWYDFHYDGGISDLFILDATTGGDLGVRPIGDSRVTVYAGSGRNAYTQVSSVVDANGVIHSVWTTGTGTTGNLYYGRKGPGDALLSETLLANSAGSFFDPPRIAIAANDDIYIGWADKRSGSSEEIYIRRLPAGSMAFDPEIRITNNSSRQYNVDLEIDSSGKVHLAWADERDGNAEIYHGVYDPAIPGMQFTQRVTVAAGSSVNPCLLLDSNNAVYLAWEDARSGQSRIYFTTTAAPSSVGGGYRDYR